MESRLNLDHAQENNLHVTFHDVGRDCKMDKNTRSAYCVHVCVTNLYSQPTF